MLRGREQMRRFTTYSMNLLPIFGKYSDPKYSVSPRLLQLFALLDILLTSFGITLITLSFAWTADDPLYGVVFTGTDLLAILVAGVLFMLTFLLSLPAFVSNASLSPKKEFSLTSLTFLNVGLFVDLVAAVVSGVIIWWRTLQERATFFVYWQQRGQNYRDVIQAKVSLRASKCLQFMLIKASAVQLLWILHIMRRSIPYTSCMRRPYYSICRQDTEYTIYVRLLRCLHPIVN